MKPSSRSGLCFKGVRLALMLLPLIALPGLGAAEESAGKPTPIWLLDRPDFRLLSDDLSSLLGHPSRPKHPDELSARALKPPVRLDWSWETVAGAAGDWRLNAGVRRGEHEDAPWNLRAAYQLVTLTDRTVLRLEGNYLVPPRAADGSGRDLSVDFRIGHALEGFTPYAGVTRSWQRNPTWDASRLSEDAGQLYFGAAFESPAWRLDVESQITDDDERYSLRFGFAFW